MSPITSHLRAGLREVRYSSNACTDWGAEFWESSITSTSALPPPTLTFQREPMVLGLFERPQGPGGQAEIEAKRMCRREREGRRKGKLPPRREIFDYIGATLDFDCNDR